MRASPQQLLSIVPRNGPLYLQLYHRIRTLILSGVWPTGTRLPSSRALANDLHISRNTAILALERLVADGWAVSRQGSGMYVSAEAPPARPKQSATAAPDVTDSFVPVPFEISEAATDVFPVEIWSKIQRKVWLRFPGDALHEGVVAGWPPLRSAISDYLNAVRGLVCSPDQVLIVSSTQAALDLCVRVLADPGDSIWVEDPGYPYPRQTFELHGLTQLPVGIDSEGIVVDDGIAKNRRSKLAYVTPACQFPSCVILSNDRRDALLNWAAGQNAFILEDDWDFDATLEKMHPPEPLAATGSQHVMFIHSFNRLLFPALRIAALVVPTELVGDFIDELYGIERFPNVSNQIALAEFMQTGMISSHLRKRRLVCEERRTAMHAGIRRHLSKWLHVNERQPGRHCVAFTRGIRDSEAAAAARAAGIACSGLNDFVLAQREVASALVIGFAAFPADVIEVGLQRLAALFADLHR